MRRPTSALFVTPLPLSIFYNNAPQLKSSTTVRASSLQMKQTPSGTPPAPTDPPDPRFSRFREFAATGGDRAVQEAMVREALWQATRAATTEYLESTIQGHLDAVSAQLSDLYLRSERDILSRNEELVRRESLQNISKWNQHLITGSKNSKISRSEILKELAIVDAMLRRNRSTKRRQKSRIYMFPPNSPLSSKRPNKRAISASTYPVGLLLTFAMCVAVIESLEGSVARSQGALHVAKCAVVSFPLVWMITHLRSVRTADGKSSAEIADVRTGDDKPSASVGDMSPGDDA